jgi:hypothetical protein
LSTRLTGQIGLRLDGQGWIARSIEFVTQSRAHHVVIAINETHVISAEPGGAVIRPMTDYPSIVWSQFDYTDEQSQHMAVLAASMNRQEYNYLGFFLIGVELIAKIRMPDSIARALSYQDRMFCSQMADFCLRKAGFDLFHSEWGMVSPGDFERYFKSQGWLSPAVAIIT